MTVRLAVRLTPRGGADRLEGFRLDAAGREQLHARVRAAPTGGEANAALEALLARALELPKSSVRVTRGAAARVKTVEIEGLDEAAVRDRLLRA